MKPQDPDSVYYALPEDFAYQPSFFFYDLETSGLSPRTDRIMQFAGQRTDLNFHPIGDPVNLLIKLSDDTLPSPQAISVTGITPQATQLDGLTEAEFCKYVMNEIFTPGTIEVGYNSVHFDDEFMRHIFWRCFYDPYEWQWKDGRSKWDFLDVVRLTRSLRPEGINWPVYEKNGELVATNRLELLTKENHIAHRHAHDASSDVAALIDVAELVHDRQPELYNYLFTKTRDKKGVKNLVNLSRPLPFVYASGNFANEFNKTSVVYPIGPGRNGNVLIFDLRFNVEDLIEQEKNFTPEEKIDYKGEKYTTRWNWSPMVKELALNRCPAIAPLGVLEVASKEASTDAINPQPKGSTGWDKIHLSREQVEQNLKILLAHPEFIQRMTKLFSKPQFEAETVDVESALYDGTFLSVEDRKACADVRRRNANELADFCPVFHDSRLEDLLLHYKARNFPTSLTKAEQKKWQEYRKSRLSRAEGNFVKELKELQQSGEHDSIAEDLLLWYQSLGDSD